MDAPIQTHDPEFEQAFAEVADVRGERMVINMGPQHPSTHGVLRIELEVEGEMVVRATPHIGYLHRGSEKIAETLTYNQFVTYTDRMDYLAPLANNVSWAVACEKLVGVEAPPRAQAIRVIVGELARISAHLLGIGAFAMDVGAMTVFLWGFREREGVYNLSEEISGARLTTSYTRIGGVTRDLSERTIRHVRDYVDQLPPKIDEMQDILARNRIFCERTQDVGTISYEDALAWGITGPNARASGVPYDVRKAEPYCGYERYDFDIPLGRVGDCYDRFLVRFEELRQSIRIVKQALAELPDGPVMVDDPKIALPQKKQVMNSMEEMIHQFIVAVEGVHPPVGEVYAATENPKGELGWYLVSDGSRSPYRCHARAPSFANLSILQELLVGHTVSDVVAILASLDFVMGECDR